MAAHGGGTEEALVRVRDLAGRPRGTGFLADHLGTMVTSHEAVDGLARLVLHAPGGQVRLAEAAAITPLPEQGLALVATEGLTAAPLPVAPGGPADPHRRTRLPLSAARGVVVASGPVTYTATDRFHLLDQAYELDLDGAEVAGLGPDASGTPLIDAATGAVLAVVATALNSGHRAGGFAVPLRPANAPEPLAALLARNAATVPAYGAHLNLAGTLHLAAASTGPATRTERWRTAVARPGITEPLRDFLTGDVRAAGTPLVLALVGEPGTGRTTELAAIAARRAREPGPAPTVWLRGADLRAADTSIADAVERALCAAARLVDASPGAPECAPADAVCAVAAAAGRPLLVVLDTPEEMPPALAHALAGWASATAAWLRPGPARLVLACRPEFWEHAGALFPADLVCGPAYGAAAVPGGVRAASAPPHRPLPPCLRVTDLDPGEAARARSSLGLEPGALRLADAAHPLALRLLSEIRAELPGAEPGPAPSRAEVFAAHLDLLCLRTAERLAADARRPVRGSELRRLAARVAGRVHEAARHCLGPGQGQLDREAFAGLFPWRTGWASAVLAEGLLVPAGAGYRFPHEEFADWLQALHLDLPAALHALVHRGLPAPRGAVVAGEGRFRVPAQGAAETVPGAAVPAGAAARSRPARHRWFARPSAEAAGRAAGVGEGGARVPAQGGTRRREAAEATAAPGVRRGARAGEGPRSVLSAGSGSVGQDRLMPSGVGGKPSQEPPAATGNPPRALKQRWFAASAGSGDGAALRVAGREDAEEVLVRLPVRRLVARSGAQPPPVPPAPAVAPRAVPVPRHRAGPVVQALLLAPEEARVAHLGALVAALGRDPGREAGWWGTHLVRETVLRAADATAYREVLGELAERIVAGAGERGGFAADGRMGDLGGFGPWFWQRLPLGAIERLDLLRVLLPADPPPPAGRNGDGKARFLDAAAMLLREDPARAVPAVCGWLRDERPLHPGAGPDRPRLTVARAAQALLHTHRRLAPDELMEALSAAAHPRAGELLAALAEDEPSAVCRAVDRWARDPRPERRAAAAAYAPMAASHARSGADRALLRHAALALLERPADHALHGAALGLLVQDPATRDRHLYPALERFTAGDPGVPAAALAAALPARPEPVLAAFGARLRTGGEGAAEVLRELAAVTDPALTGRLTALLADHLAHRPEQAGGVAAYLDLRLERGPAVRAELVALTRAVLRDHPPQVRRTLLPVFAAPGTPASRPLRQELLDLVLDGEHDPEVLDALLAAAADGCRGRRPVRTRALVHRLGLLLGRDPEGAARFDRRVVEFARADPEFGRLVRGWLTDGAAWDAVLGPSARRRLEAAAAPDPAGRGGTQAGWRRARGPG
ncbi:serine protease [Actinacidiphila acididurans]|uniref:Serine protease n=1 Tax=Actinacidiphila acididurans TaxID=2784346 RepID=A0ABS2TKY0_9ACTN|nr:serine protease [Actinacidiphila acididurans]MBM9503985.1 serine protease [Actinacidiphila acididurans]